MNKKLKDFVRECLEEERQRYIKAGEWVEDSKGRVDYFGAKVEQAEASGAYEALLRVNATIIEIEAEEDLESITLFTEGKLPKNKTILQLEANRGEEEE